MKISYLIYPDMTLLDLVGPLQIWNNFPELDVQIVSKSMDPVTTDARMTVLPTHTFNNADELPDIFFIPGGMAGTDRVCRDQETLDFVRRQGNAATWVTSVCTGSIVLGAAGLLEGYKAATHWAAMPLLSEYGATPVNERYVIDRNRATGGGVTAGIDFGLALMAEITGEAFAKAIQLGVEYAPQPPFDSGTPQQADPEILALVKQRFAEVRTSQSQSVTE